MSKLASIGARGGQKLSVSTPTLAGVSIQPPPDWVAPSSPGLGRPLVPRVERLAQVLRAAVAQIESQARVPFVDLYAPDRPGLGFTLPAGQEGTRAAWALVGEWLVAASVGGPAVSSDLGTAHAWFWAGSGREFGRAPSVSPDLRVDDPVELRALMPYLLDPMSAATRRDVLAEHSTHRERRRRKAAGAFYTPGDVAYLMASPLAARDQRERPQRWFDPAHGSGVFLRAALSLSRDHSSSTSHIYGVDLEPMAAEITSFVLVAEDIALSPEGEPPWQRWHRFRRNLATADALLIDTSAPEHSSREALPGVTCPEINSPLGSTGSWRLSTVFPETDGVFTSVIANPPYAPLRPDGSTEFIPSLRPVTGSSLSQDVSPGFVELCTQLLTAGGAMIAVTPLSVVTSTRSPFPELRAHLAEQPGALELLSFDRAPDALFGDDIKTRNAIVHLDRVAPAGLTATPLHRWTSRNRRSALESVPRTSVSDLPGVPKVIPKIGAQWERELFMACAESPVSMRDWLIGRWQLPLQEVHPAARVDQSSQLAVASTAYNFLGVVRDPRRAVADGHDSRNPYAFLQFDSAARAAAGYAVLNSRVAFWLWHATGDGFHVTDRLLSQVPMPEPGAEAVETLARLGELLWQSVCHQPVVSRNRGRTTVAYPGWTIAELVDQIDGEIARVLGLPLGASLAEWHSQLVIVDADSKRRSLIQRKM